MNDRPTDNPYLKFVHKLGTSALSEVDAMDGAAELVATLKFYANWLRLAVERVKAERKEA